MRKEKRSALTRRIAPRASAFARAPVVERAWLASLTLGGVHHRAVATADKLCSCLCSKSGVGVAQFFHSPALVGFEDDDEDENEAPFEVGCDLCSLRGESDIERPVLPSVTRSTFDADRQLE